MEKKSILLYCYKAVSDHKPDNLYDYARENGIREEIFEYHDLKEAVFSMKNFESSCKMNPDGSFIITCYALEVE